MAGVRNLTQVEAADRARLLEVTGYDIALDLTDGHGNPGDGTFRSTTEPSMVDTVRSSGPTDRCSGSSPATRARLSRSGLFTSTLVVP